MRASNLMCEEELVVFPNVDTQCHENFKYFVRKVVVYFCFIDGGI
jgi:hypothetical protein